MKAINLTNKTMGELTALKRVGTTSSNHALWRCKCSCGKIINLSSQALRRGQKTCGCIKRRWEDLTGRHFHKLTVVKRIENYCSPNGDTHIQWQCVCNCGRKLKVCTSPLKRGKVKTCGKNRCRSRLTLKQRLLNKVLTRYKSDAKKRNLTFKLTKIQFESFLWKNCHYCGNGPINIHCIDFKDADETLLYNGIDRLDSCVGYTITNSVPCCGNCNKMKSNTPYSDFLKHVIKIAEHQSGSNDS